MASLDDAGEPLRDILDSDDSLPGLDEIEATGKLLFEQGNTRILLLPSNVVVKYGPTVRTEEAATLKFVNQYTGVLAPRLCGVRIQRGPVLDKDGDTGAERSQTCIYMTYIPGDPLSILLPGMDKSILAQIVEEIGTQVRKLRELKNEGYIGSVNRGVCLDPLFRPGSAGGHGPFESEEAMNEFLINNDVGRSHTMKHHMRKLMYNTRHEIYFTHGDLVPRNILVEDGHLSGIVDWQIAGWYPDYWEFVRASCTHYYNDAWCEYIENIVPADYCHALLYLQLRE